MLTAMGADDKPEDNLYEVFLNYDYNRVVGTVKLSGISRKLYEQNNMYLMIPIFETDAEGSMTFIGFSMVHRDLVDWNKLKEFK